MSPRNEGRPTAGVKNLRLDDLARNLAYKMAVTVESCGQRWAAFRRVEIEGGESVEIRLACQLRCGTRACIICDAEIRRRQKVRTEGPWKLFLTLGVPRAFGDVLASWRKITKALNRLLRTLRREAADAWTQYLDFDQDAHDYVSALNAALPDGARRAPLLQYAWALEPHKSGYPHVHMITNASYVGYEWLRREWSKATGVKCRWVFGRKVFSTDGVCRYLAKYVSKASFPLELCAVMYRKRLWASTIPKGEDPEPIWLREDNRKGDDVKDEAGRAKTWGINEGWKVKISADGKYAIWERRFSLIVHVIAKYSTVDSDDFVALDGLETHAIERAIGGVVLKKRKGRGPD